MDYKITPEQLDKILKPYFDNEFDKSEWGEYDYQHGGGKWYGFVNQKGILIAGYPSHLHGDSIIFSDGKYFGRIWNLFSVEPQDFHDSMGRYIGNRYGKWFNTIR
jgi:hypothetical protein